MATVGIAGKHGHNALGIMMPCRVCQLHWPHQGACLGTEYLGIFYKQHSVRVVDAYWHSPGHVDVRFSWTLPGSPLFCSSVYRQSIGKTAPTETVTALWNIFQSFQKYLSKSGLTQQPTALLPELLTWKARSDPGKRRADVCGNSGSDPGREAGEAWKLFLVPCLLLSALGLGLSNTHRWHSRAGRVPVLSQRMKKSPRQPLTVSTKLMAMKTRELCPNCSADTVT